jgi:hypothetical protein
LSTFGFFVVLLMAGGVWMLWDAIRRRADAFWLAILILLFPFSWPAYFLVVKSRDYDWGRVLRGRRAAPNASLDELEAKATVAGTDESKLNLAEALEAAERAGEAEAIFRSVLIDNPNDLRALHGLARALMSLQRPREAVEALEKVLEVDRAYRAYSAALDYAEALWQDGQREDTLDLLEAMAATTGRMNHRVAHAHYLTVAGKPERARVVLTEALEAYESYPFVDKRREQYWAIRAEQMLDELAT